MTRWPWGTSGRIRAWNGPRRVGLKWSVEWEWCSGLGYVVVIFGCFEQICLKTCKYWKGFAKGFAWVVQVLGMQVGGFKPSAFFRLNRNWSLEDFMSCFFPFEFGISCFSWLLFGSCARTFVCQPGPLHPTEMRGSGAASLPLLRYSFPLVPPVFAGAGPSVCRRYRRRAGNRHLSEKCVWLTKTSLNFLKATVSLATSPYPHVVLLWLKSLHQSVLLWADFFPKTWDPERAAALRSGSLMKPRGRFLGLIIVICPRRWDDWGV